MIQAGRDLEVFPNSHSKTIFDALASPDKEYWLIPDALHYFEAEDGDEGTRALDRLMAKLVPWLEARFPL